MSKRKQKAPQKRPVVEPAQQLPGHLSVSKFAEILRETTPGDYLNQIRAFQVFHSRDLQRDLDIIIGMINMVEPNLRVGPSTIPDAGNGLFVKTTKILAGEFITGYGGIRMNANFYESNAELVLEHPGLDAYMVELPDGSFLDGRTMFRLGGEAGRWINDRGPDDANCMFILTEKGLVVQAIRDIEPGEELFLNYGKKYWDPPTTKALKLCALCGERALFRCEHCRETNYCSRKCQLMDANMHLDWNS